MPTLLQMVIAEITAMLHYRPCGRFAWRLHPDDAVTVVEELRAFGVQFGTEIASDWKPLKSFEILGVRIFPDIDAPRFTSSVGLDTL